MDGDVRGFFIEGCAEMGIALTQDATSRFETYLSLLQSWGRKINLTTRLEAKDVVIHHFLDSLSGVRFISAESGARVIDLGAGAGLPSFPLKFALPLLRLTLIESVRKKVSFCQEVISHFQLPGCVCPSGIWYGWASGQATPWESWARPAAFFLCPIACPFCSSDPSA